MIEIGPNLAGLIAYAAYLGFMLLVFWLIFGC